MPETKKAPGAHVVGVKMEPALIRAIDDHRRQASFIVSRSEAIRQILRRQLKVDACGE